MNRQYPEVSLRARHRCEYCRAPEAIFNFPFEVEHIVAAALGGPSTQSNLALACRACNARKAARTEGTDPRDGGSVRLFHPRDDRWEDHFQFDMKTMEILGTTPVGRATVDCLGFNADFQLAARKRWLQLGLFP